MDRNEFIRDFYSPASSLTMHRGGVKRFIRRTYDSITSCGYGHATLEMEKSFVLIMDDYMVHIIIFVVGVSKSMGPSFF